MSWLKCINCRYIKKDGTCRNAHTDYFKLQVAEDFICDKFSVNIKKL